MSKNRILFDSDIVLKSEYIGFGTDNPLDRLHVAGTTKGIDFKLDGDSTLTSYGGFVYQNHLIDLDFSLEFEGELIDLSTNVVVSENKILDILSNSTLNISTLDSLTIENHLGVPVGGTTERVDNPVEGSVRFNNDLNTLEFWNGIEWRQFTVTGASGRGVFGGGVDTGNNNLSVIEYVNISSFSNSYYFGDMTVARRNFSTASSETRGIFSGSNNPSTNLLEYVTIASQGNAIDFGQLSITGAGSGCSSSTRGIFAGGNSPENTNTIEYITIHTLGNGLDFGDLIVSVDLPMAASSPTRAVIAGGRSPSFNSLINYITISSTGDAKDFGDLTTRKVFTEGCSSSTRGIFAGGQIEPSSSGINTIEYLTFTTLGNSIYFGDLTKNRKNIGVTSNNTRGLFGGGYDPEYTNIIDYVNISTVGNAKDFGDLSTFRRSANALSDSHGGLGGF